MGRVRRERKEFTVDGEWLGKRKKGKKDE